MVSKWVTSGVLKWFTGSDWHFFDTVLVSVRPTASFFSCWFLHNCRQRWTMAKTKKKTSRVAYWQKRKLKILPSNWRLTLTSIMSLPRKLFASNTLFLLSACLSIRRSIDTSVWKRGCNTVRTERSYHTNIFKEKNPRKTVLISWGFNYETTND